MTAHGDDDNGAFYLHCTTARYVHPVPRHTMKKVEYSTQAMVDTASGKTGLAGTSGKTGQV